MRVLILAGVCAAASLAGCAMAPLSFVDGQPRTHLPMNHYPVRVVSVDGSLQFRNPIQVAPGPHSLVFEAAPLESSRRTSQRTYMLKVEPCTHYFFMARRKSPLLAEWDLVVHSTEAVHSCKPEEELEKAER